MTEPQVDGQLDVLDVIDEVLAEELALEGPGAKLRGDARHTSRTAAQRTLLKSGSARRRVLDALVRTLDGGLTDEELQAYLRMGPNTQRPRRVELVEAGFVEPKPGATRVTSSGSPAIVWQATQAGRDALARAIADVAASTVTATRPAPPPPRGGDL